jgi:hypothetical protein
LLINFIMFIVWSVDALFLPVSSRLEHAMNIEHSCPYIFLSVYQHHHAQQCNILHMQHPVHFMLACICMCLPCILKYTQESKPLVQIHLHDVSIA